jgi:hypothetical protein
MNEVMALEPGAPRREDGSPDRCFSGEEGSLFGRPGGSYPEAKGGRAMKGQILDFSIQAATFPGRTARDTISRALNGKGSTLPGEA